MRQWRGRCPPVMGGSPYRAVLRGAGRDWPHLINGCLAATGLRIEPW